MPHRFFALVLLSFVQTLFLIGAGAGCGNDQQASSDDCSELDSRAAECELLETGSVCRIAPTDVEQCVADCQMQADCDYLAELLCSDKPPPLPDPDEEPDTRGRIALCIDQCQFRCDDEIVLDARFRCDAVVDCVDGTDERGCDDAQFTCSDGGVIPLIWTCDGQSDCCLDDPSCRGEDEQGCPDEPTVLACGS